MLDDPLTLLALYGLWVIVTMVAQVSAAASQVGLAVLSSARDEMEPLDGVAGRLERALHNSVVALALVAPPVLVVALRAAEAPSENPGGISITPPGPDPAILAMQIFLVARILYVPIYAAGIPVLRTLVWGAGLLATLWLYLQAL